MNLNELQKEILLATYRANPCSPEAIFNVSSLGVWVNETYFQFSQDVNLIKNAINKLLSFKLMKDTGTRNETFVLTQNGLCYAERLNNSNQ